MPKRSEANQDHNQVTLIAKGTEIEGTITVAGDIRVNGNLLGELKVAGRVVISESGLLGGSLEADDAFVAGKVEGDMVVKNKSLLGSKARFTGNIQTARLVVEEGAIMNGVCQMGKPGEGLKEDAMAPNQKTKS